MIPPFPLTPVASLSSLPSPELPMTNITPVQKALHSAIVDAFDKHGRYGLSENADSPLVVLALVRDLASAVEAAAKSLSYHAGMDGPEFVPALVEEVDGDFRFECERVAEERGQ